MAAARFHDGEPFAQLFQSELRHLRLGADYAHDVSSLSRGCEAASTPRHWPEAAADAKSAPSVLDEYVSALRGAREDHVKNLVAESEARTRAWLEARNVTATETPDRRAAKLPEKPAVSPSSDDDDDGDSDGDMGMPSPPTRGAAAGRRSQAPLRAAGNPERDAENGRAAPRRAPPDVSAAATTRRRRGSTDGARPLRAPAPAAPPARSSSDDDDNAPDLAAYGARPLHSHRLLPHEPPKPPASAAGGCSDDDDAPDLADYLATKRLKPAPAPSGPRARAALSHASPDAAAWPPESDSARFYDTMPQMHPKRHPAARLGRVVVRRSPSARESTSSLSVSSEEHSEDAPRGKARGGGPRAPAARGGGAGGAGRWQHVEAPAEPHWMAKSSF
ncbi:hypothetical protein M885DRAFT_579290 [Pelagophyceae sp. CCMP2097]|nr:hypothetical protein M885DRAFT_579290 [Pelagophyceae sp. CCMP2097]